MCVLYNKMQNYFQIVKLQVNTNTRMIKLCFDFYIQTTFCHKHLSRRLESSQSHVQAKYTAINTQNVVANHNRTM